MPIDAGKLRHRVQLQKQSQAQDSDSGEVTVTWQTQATVWAAVEPLSVREFLQSQSMQSEITTRITIRRIPNVDATWRVLHGSTAYNIHGIQADPVSGLEYLTLPCSAGVNKGGA